MNAIRFLFNIHSTNWFPLLQGANMKSSWKWTAEKCILLQRISASANKHWETTMRNGKATVPEQVFLQEKGSIFPPEKKILLAEKRKDRNSTFSPSWLFLWFWSEKISKKPQTWVFRDNSENAPLQTAPTIKLYFKAYSQCNVNESVLLLPPFLSTTYMETFAVLPALEEELNNHPPPHFLYL